MSDKGWEEKIEAGVHMLRELARFLSVGHINERFPQSSPTFADASAANSKANLLVKDLGDGMLIR